MPTYEYECSECGLRFEQRQAITDEPLKECPECRGNLHRLVSGGTGFIFKGESRGSSSSPRGFCSLETPGKTCCGRDQRCGKPSCGEGD